MSERGESTAHGKRTGREIGVLKKRPRREEGEEEGRAGSFQEGRQDSIRYRNRGKGERIWGEGKRVSELPWTTLRMDPKRERFTISSERTRERAIFTGHQKGRKKTDRKCKGNREGRSSE